MNKGQLSILKLNGVFCKQGLSIPNYQRPYCWTEKNINQLIDDLIFFMNQEKKEYRLGNLIIHKDKDVLNIVDGQQRLITLSIILYIIDSNCENLLLSSKFNSDLSVNKIIENKSILEKKLFHLQVEIKSKLKDFILNNCEFVYIELDDLSEAFQLFDSQNARGKALESYDLLKAFHLREMTNGSEDEKLECVKKWELYVDNNKIGNILGNNLYRIRKWSRGEDAYYLDKDSIDEFKGINLSKVKDYPYLKSYLLNIYLTEDISKNALLSELNFKINFPFQINQIIINGKYFFKYVYYYSELFDKLFDNKNADFYTFYSDYTYYDGCGRQGDVYVKELYQAIIMAYFDKFGAVDFKKAFVSLYKWSYKLRIKQSRVSYLSIDKYVRENPKFKQLANYYDSYQSISDRITLPEKIEKNIPKILEIFNKKEL